MDKAEIDRLALGIAGQGTPLERVQRLVDWTNHEFKWSATDYQQRTVDEIIARRNGNCAELSKVLIRLLTPTGIPYRWVAEINIHPYTPRRQETAEAKVKERGNRMSVFGLRHNDHRWLEIEASPGEWVPADPSIGVVGASRWVAMRMGLGTRPQPTVKAVAEIVQEMKVPFVVIVPSTDTAPAVDRSHHYLVDEFNRYYGGKLSSLAAWPDWVRAIDELSPQAIGAFAGKLNLHEKTEGIAHVAETYELLQRQARNRRLTPPE